MGKRIHKREGSVAWGNAMRKSAGRMERDLMRVSDREKKKQILCRYMENKTHEQRAMLDLIEEYQHLDQQSKSIATRAKDFFDKVRKKKGVTNVRELKTARGSFELIQADLRRKIAIIDALQKANIRITSPTNRKKLAELHNEATALIAGLDRRIAGR